MTSILSWYCDHVPPQGSDPFIFLVGVIAVIIICLAGIIAKVERNSMNRRNCEDLKRSADLWIREGRT